ncbi:MAG: hypothetical protein IJT77_06110 [Clostridia bacterium]|nr:hypothetical protein [Clostridia bacterium]
MASIVYQTDKRNGSTYAYPMESVRDPVTGKCKPKRTYIGRVDPVTQTIVEKAPSGKRNRGGITKRQIDQVDHATAEMLEQMKAEIASLKEEIQRLKNEKDQSDCLFEKSVDSINNRHDSDKPV